MPAVSFRVALSALAAAAGLLAGAGGALAQSLPSFEQYPLRDRVFGSGGALFPDYSNPSERGTTFVTGGAGTRASLFAAGTIDFNCQQTQVPAIRVLSAPPTGQVRVGFSRFTITGTDGGRPTRCMGQAARGMVVSFKGKAAPGAQVRLRVTYPPMGAWYDHTVTIPPR